jgi:adenosylcobinamide-GDP ribazoletransferase
MLSALSFLTVLGRGRTPDATTLRWFPPVGAVIGAVVGLVWWGAAELWPPLLAAAIAVVADLVITGMLHVDGLADSADGLLPHADRTRRLAIMATPDVGAFGVAVVAVTLLLRVVALASIEPEPLVLVGLWCSSRTLVAAVPALVPYARPGGLATPFAAGASPFHLAWLAPSGAVLAVATWPLGLVAVLAATAAGTGVVALAKARLGGYTGDVLGAVIVTAETVGLVALAAR